MEVSLQEFKDTDQKVLDEGFGYLFRKGHKGDPQYTIALRNVYDVYHRLLALAERLDRRVQVVEEQMRRMEVK